MSVLKAFKWRTKTRAGSPASAGSEIHTLASHIADTDPHPGLATSEEVTRKVEAKVGALESLASHKTAPLSHAPKLVRRDELGSTLEDYNNTKDTDYSHDPNSYNSLTACAHHVVTTQLLMTVLENVLGTIGNPVDWSKVVKSDTGPDVPVREAWKNYIPAYNLYRQLRIDFDGHKHTKADLTGQLDWAQVNHPEVISPSEVDTKIAEALKKASGGSPDYINGKDLITVAKTGDTVAITTMPEVGMTANVKFTATADCWILFKGFDYYNNSSIQTWLSAVKIYNGSTLVTTLSEVTSGSPAVYDATREVFVPSESKLIPLTKGTCIQFSAQFAQIELKYFPIAAGS